jgi:6-pyruvoyltetrahydropterin/6-carboxytetrahydropterin synthase
MNRFQLEKTFLFEAAHRNTQGDQKTSRVHGHNYRATVVLEDWIDPSQGWFLDFGDLDALVAPVVDRLDHHYLNDAMGTANARVEDVAAWLTERLSKSLRNLVRVHVAIEGESHFALLRLAADLAVGHPERLAFGFAAAHRLPRVRPGHRCGGPHGHSFIMQVAAPDLDGLAPRLRAIHDTLDHVMLNDVPGLDNPTSENIALWAWDRLTREGAAPTLIVIEENATSRCVYRGPEQSKRE